MARNEEKAQSLLNRWTSMKQDFSNTFNNRRPYSASLCNNLRDAERFRRQIIQEISKKVADIQNAGLSEHVIRDLNDGINKLMREKRHWEHHIVTLGGTNYTRSSQPQIYDDNGEVIESVQYGGYKYFGAAKNLPGVKELFEKQEEIPQKHTKQDLSERVDVEYYGYREDEDIELLQAEMELEKELQAKLIQEWNEKQQLQHQIRQEMKTS